jgi:hypothetical protein
MFETKWNYLPNSTFDTLGFNGVNTVTSYDNLITSAAYVNSLKSGIKGKFSLIDDLTERFKSMN